jgi:hypothetical protein
VTNSLVVGSLHDLTTEWATAAIGTGNATAKSVTVAGVVTGSNIKARLALEWTGSDAQKQPRAIVVKANFAHRDGGDDIDRSVELRDRYLVARGVFAALDAKREGLGLRLQRDRGDDHRGPSHARA